jgi:Lysylphosphatidylglycerol synthase TM region
VPRKRLLNAAFILLALVAAGFAARHFVSTGWPLRQANLWLVGLSVAIFFASYAAKAWGWQHLFRADQRPAVLTLAAAGGAAAVGGIALPGRFDEVLRVGVVRRCRRRRASFGAVALSLFVLGLLDSVALMPFASASAVLGGVGGWLRAGLIVVAVAGLGSAGVVLALPRLTRFRPLARLRLAEHATTPRQAGKAWVGVAASWTLRTMAVFVLLAALGLGTDFSLALAFVCGSAASAVLPVAPAGAATQVGAGAAILSAAGVHTEQAVAFGLAAQGLAIGVGAMFVLALGAWHAQGQLASRGHLAAA